MNKQLKRFFNDSDAFDKITNAASNDEAEILVELRSLYQSALQEQKSLSIKLKALSHKIGQEKKQGGNIDLLRENSRSTSQQLRLSTEKLGHIENKIQVLIDQIRHEIKTHISEENSLSSSDSGSEQGPAYRYVTDVNQDITVDIIDSSTLRDEKSELVFRCNQYVMQHAAGTIHHDVRWHALLTSTYGHESYYYYACSIDGCIRGVLPIVRLKSRLFGDLMVSMPYFQRAGAIADSLDTENKLIETANLTARSAGVETIEYRDDIPRENLFSAEHKVNMILTLPGTTESLWHSFTSKLRSQIKRAQRERPEIYIGKQDCLDDFYRVYSHNMRDLGSPAHSKRFINGILETFSENSWLVVVYHKKRAVAAALLLMHDTTMEIPLASTIRSANPISINMYLYWEVLKFAINRGCNTFDFGRSSIGAGTYRFKAQWGAKPKQLYWHYWLADTAEIPGLNPENPKFLLAISVWKRLPVLVTNWISPFIIRNLP